MGDKRYLHRDRRRRKRRGARKARDEIRGGNWGSVGNGEPSSARNRPAGKRDTTGRLHYRAPTCFLSLRRRGLFTLASRPPSRVSSLSLPWTSRFFRPTAYIQIRFIGFLCYTWGHWIQFPIGSDTHARLIFCKTRNTSRSMKLSGRPRFLRQTQRERVFHGWISSSKEVPFKGWRHRRLGLCCAIPGFVLRDWLRVAAVD